MQYFFSQHIQFFLFAFLTGTILSFLVLTLICKSTKNFLSFFHLKAEKSHTNASLLGGLSLSTSALAVIGSLIFYGDNKFSGTEMLILKCSIFPILVTTLYGYLDDKYEIRARHKLTLQLISIASFVLPLSSSLYHGQNQFMIFTGIFGLAYINGCNLIDGLDTLFAKVGTITSLAFLALAIQSGSIPAITISLLITSSLCTFYFFNKEPAKIYAGEIGGSILGMLLFIQANFLIATLKGPSQLALTGMIFKILIVSIYPLSELGITFSRRIFFKQSPFRGDHLHIHHIIKSKFNLNPSKTSNIIASILMMTIMVGQTMIYALSPAQAFFLALATLSCIYTSTCLKHWIMSYSKNNKKEIFLNLNESVIHVIDSKAIEILYSKYSPSNISNYSKDEDIAA